MSVLKIHGFASRLKAARERRSLAVVDLASAIGISTPAYYDLEAHDDEATMSISIEQLGRACRAVGVPLSELLQIPRAASQLSLDELAALLSRRLASEAMTQDLFETQIGWGVGDFMERPAVALSWNLDELASVCGGLGVDWRQLVNAIEATSLH